MNSMARNLLIILAISAMMPNETQAVSVLEFLQRVPKIFPMRNGWSPINWWKRTFIGEEEFGEKHPLTKYNQTLRMIEKNGNENKMEELQSYLRIGKMAHRYSYEIKSVILFSRLSIKHWLTSSFSLITCPALTWKG